MTGPSSKDRIVTMCPHYIKLRDYGKVFCARQEAHDGDHFATSPYDSRDIGWKLGEIVGATSDAATTTPENVDSPA